MANRRLGKHCAILLTFDGMVLYITNLADCGSWVTRIFGHARPPCDVAFTGAYSHRTRLLTRIQIGGEFGAVRLSITKFRADHLALHVFHPDRFDNT